MLIIFKRKYIGTWKDDNGKMLVIRKEKDSYSTDFYINESSIERILLGDLKVHSIQMKSYFDETDLIVELGSVGLGPTLKLKYVKTIKEGLIPTVLCGLYDDLEDDLGVPWVLPLAIYYKIGE